MSDTSRLKRSRDPVRGRGVAAAQRTFNSYGAGSNPADLIGSVIATQRDRGVSGSTSGSYPEQ